MIVAPSTAPETVQISERPWFVWTPQYGLDGEVLRDPIALEGDEAFTARLFPQARARYERALTRSISLNEARAISVRLASVRLELGQPGEALLGMSRFFRAHGLGVNDVDSYHALLFGFSYQKQHNKDQALAWFSRAARGQDEILGRIADSALESEIASLDEAAFEKAREAWRTDERMAELFARDAGRRNAGLVFGGQPAGMQPAETPPLVPGSIAALLPLSGKYGAVGKAFRDGLELAFESSLVSHQMKIAFDDVGSDTASIESIVAGRLTSPDTQLIVGPLLADQALIARSQILAAGKPAVLLSKAQHVSTSSTMLRYAVTAHDQLRSLLSAARQSRSIRRFILVTPNDQSGAEFSAIAQPIAERLGIEFLGELTYDPTVREVVALAGAIEQSQTEAVVMVGSTSWAARVLGALNPKFSERLVVLGTALWDDARALSQSQKVMQGVLIVSPFSKSSVREEQKRFRELFQQRYGKEADLIAAQGFDLGTLLIEADAQKQIGQSLTDALVQLPEYRGITGISVAKFDGEFERTFPVYVFDKGKLVSLETPVLGSLESAVETEVP